MLTEIYIEAVDEGLADQVPEIGGAVVGGKDVNSDDQKKQVSPSIYLQAFLKFVPDYCADEDGQLVGSPEKWQAQVISYSLYLGLGIDVLDKKLGERLLEGMTQGVRETSDFALTGLDEVRKAVHPKKGDRWSHAVSFLSNLMSLASPETTGQNADEELVKQRAPICGLMPALRLSVESPIFANELYGDAVHEQQKCDAEELLARIEFMKEIMDDVMEEIRKRHDQ